MPPMTTVQTFIDALRRRQTNTTLGFDAIFTPPYVGQEWFEPIHSQGAFDDQLPGWAVQALAQRGVSAREIAHINIWPNDKKEQARQAVQEAIDRSPPIAVRFFWDLTDAPEPDVNVNKDVVPFEVTFFTPRSAVRQVGPDDIDVGLYPPPPA